MGKNKIFRLIQEYLKQKPLIIWGSGATIPFGMPSMDDLKEELEITENGNLETILSKISNETEKNRYEEKIYKCINTKDSNFRENFTNKKSKPLKALISYFYKAHPQLLNIITTNYDCILEYVLAYHNIPYSDGFLGKEFSEFNSGNFKTKEHINLYKVHGSLRWHKKRYSYHNSMMDGVFPNQDKYETTSKEPYRTIITKSDEAIEDALCFLSIGFGFNDEHITPKIETAIRGDKSIVVIAKTATESTKEKLANASCYVLIETGEQTDSTLFTIKEKDKEVITETLGENYWKIDEFNKILMGENL